jgi:hypothetical protein
MACGRFDTLQDLGYMSLVLGCMSLIPPASRQHGIELLALRREFAGELLPQVPEPDQSIPCRWGIMNSEHMSPEKFHTTIQIASFRYQSPPFSERAIA